MQYYTFDHRYGEIFADVGIPMKELLHKSNLPESLFSRSIIRLTKEEVFRLMETAGTLVPDDGAIVRIATWKDIQTFSPPVFAAYCSGNALNCVERLSRYKQLVCPLIFTPRIIHNEFHVEIRGDEEGDRLPTFWAEVEAAFIVSLIRLATKEKIKPLRVRMCHEVTNPKLIRFWGCPVEVGPRNEVVFSMTAARRRFVSENEEMWSFFEPELKRRLAELRVGDAYSARTRNALIDLLASGSCKIDDVASRLCISKRTLQRKLAEEHTSFQQLLNEIRKVLALHYIKEDQLQNNDIAFLLGYQDTNAYLRAFNTWTGMSMTEYKRLHKEEEEEDKEP